MCPKPHYYIQTTCFAYQLRRNNLVTYFDSSHELAQEKIPQQRAGILSCKNQSYDDSVVVAFDTGNCSIKLVFRQITR